VRIVSYRRDDGAERFGIVDGADVRDAGADLADLAPAGAVGRLDELTLLAPVPRPGKVVCVGRNYAEHAAETGSPVPDRPQLFAKWENAVVGPGVDVVHHAITAQLDYEAELVVVIGRTARRVPEARALDVVLGYTCGDDVSARDLQLGDTQWIRGKTLDTFAPTGPWIVTADEIPDPQALPIRCEVNGEVRQDDTTAHMLFGVAELIAFVTEAITLEPGDLLFTGTPPGVGHGMKPPRYLAVGDRIRVEIGRIGAIEHAIVSAPSLAR
jgi:2-keto-4-pentenoate hydratase/2-oxohepta-3-ene-1,7-dioic acid hydratase in catechol pathway